MDGTEKELLKGGVEHGEHTGGLLGMAAGEAVVGLLANVGDITVEHEGGSGALTDHRDDGVEKALGIDAGSHLFG